MQGSDGLLYGTTICGGAFGQGTIFSISRSGSFKTIFNFHGPHGKFPEGALIEGSDGNYYGTTTEGGIAPNPHGVIFKVAPTGGYTDLYNFGCGTDGCVPHGGLVQATDGNFYGTNEYGGDYFGVIYRLTPAGEFTTLHNFEYDTGFRSRATLLQHTNGILYGHTAIGGIFSSVFNGDGYGVFYSLDIGSSPFVRLLPEAGNVGAKIGILGQGFTGTNAVSFHGTAATFTVVSDTYLTATVPVGATTGPVTVNTPGGLLTSNRKFLISPPAADLNLKATPYPTPPVQGGLLTYSFKIWNQSSVAAVHEVLTTQVPAGSSFSRIVLSGTAGLGSCTTPAVGASGPVICKENSVMRPGSTWTIRMAVQITAPAGTVITETATASSDNAPSTTATIRNTVH